MLPPRSRHLIVRTGSLSLWRGANCEIARATFSSLCLHRIALVAVRCEFSGRPRNLNRHFVRIGSLSLWRGENCEIARATFSSRCAVRCEFSGRLRNLLVTLCASDRSRRGVVRIFDHPRNLLVTLRASDRSRCGVRVLICMHAHATFSALWACQIALATARCSC